MSPTDTKTSLQVWHRNDTIVLLASSMAALVLHIVFAARQPTSWDSVHYVRGVSHFDVTQYWPHAPGYWLFEFSARIVWWLTPLNTYWSALFISALGASLSVGVAYAIGRIARSRWVGIACAAVLATMPLLWFYGSIVATNSFDVLAMLLLILLAFRAKPGNHTGVLACIALGFAGGFRPSSFMVFLPVTLWVVARSVRTLRSFIMCVLAGAASVAAWFVPMIFEQPGGLSPIRETSNRLLEDSLNATSYFRNAPGSHDNILQVLGISFATLLPYLPLILFSAIVAIAPITKIRLRKHQIVPLVLAGAPGLFEVTFLHMGVPGYALTFLPAIAIAIVLFASSPHASRIASISLTVLLIGLCMYQTQRFVFGEGILPQRASQVTHIWENKYGAPFPQTWRGIKRLDQQQMQLRSLRQEFDPARDVLIFVSLNGSTSYRYAGYQLPEFTIHLIEAGADLDQARNGRHSTHVDRTIEIPRGGHAVFVLDFSPEELRHGIDNRSAYEKQLPDTGHVVYVADPGQTLYGIQFVEGDLPKI